MTPAARLQSAIVLVGEIESIARPADAVISGWFRGQRGLDDKDRGAILDVVYGVMRHRARLAWWLERFGREETARSRVLAYALLCEGKNADQLARLFNGAKDGPAILAGGELALVKKLQGGTIDHPSMPEAVMLECPDWAEEALRRRFGGAFAAEMRAMMGVPTLDLRVNTLKAARDKVMGDLSAAGLGPVASRVAPQGIRLPERMALSRIAALKTGEVEIQDEGSQLVALLVDAKPSQRIVDFCAGACGKTLALAAQMQNKGQIVACDVNAARLKRGAERLRHAGVHNVETRVLESETDKWIKRHKGIYDRVLVDAPCSGTGTWRRNPDARWRTPEEKGLANLVALQGRILASAARLVKPGGRLVYATCSVLTEENEDQVTAFLAANPAFRLVPAAEVVPALQGVVDGEVLSLTPARHDTDGFFAAVLERRADG